MSLARLFLRFSTPDGPVVTIPPTRMVALCDVDSAILAQQAKVIEEEFGVTVDTYTDYRKLLKRSDIDAVVLATPNHWHALQTIWACEAGKDVYVEKPICHSVWEGRQMVAAARKHRRVVQCGFQSRSDMGLLEAVPRIRNGELGAIKHIRGLCYRNRTTIGRQSEPLVPPSTVDYDQWLGPAEDLPMYRPQFHYDWHWVWNTGNADLGNQGPHELDHIRWFLGGPDHPRKVFSFGGRFGWDDAGETPNMQVTGYLFDDVPAHFEVRNLWVNPQTNNSPNFLDQRVGVIVTCEGGSFRGGGGGGHFYDNDGNRVASFPGRGGVNHLPNFLNCIQSRKQNELASTIEDGFYSSALAHLGNISYQLGETVGNDSLLSAIGNNEWLVEIHQRYMGQLRDWNLKEDQLEWTLGPQLNFEAAREQFTGELAGPANALLRRDGRAPYTIPEYV